MNKVTTVAGCGAIAIGMCLTASPAAAVTIKPGPVKAVFPQVEDETSPTSNTSKLYYMNWATYVDLTSQGPIVWRGKVTEKGRLTFPRKRQVWPKNGLMRSISIKGLSGKMRPNGKVTLTGTMKAVVTAPTGECKITTPITLSTRIAPPFTPGGQDYDPDTGSVALMSQALPLSSSGGTGCELVLKVQPVVFLSGSMKVPGGVAIPRV